MVVLNSKNQYYSLDGLRGISILIVIFSHFNHLFHFKVLDYLFNAGIVGVYMFFVLSGFLITTLLLKEKAVHNHTNLKKFYLRRFYRIVPLSWLYIIVVFLITTIFKIGFDNGSIVIAALYLVNISSVFSVPYLFIHYWSLSAEEQYYLLVPPIFKFGLKIFKIVLPLILLSTFLFRYLAVKNPDVMLLNVLSDISRNLDGLVIGSIFAVLFYKNKLPINFLLKNRVLINSIIFPLLLILNHETSYLFFKIFANHTFYSILIGLVIVINIHPSKDIYFKVFNHKIITEIGILSYSLYIWQQLFSSGLIPVSPYLNLIFLFITAYLSYYYFEKPFLRVKSKYSVV